jgi:hypothetical protein
MKHTPGPWMAFYKPKYGEWHVSLPVSGSAVRLGIFPRGLETASTEADAHLIAAAPEMLESLKALCALCEHFSGAEHDETEQAKQVIAKAEGQK